MSRACRGSTPRVRVTVPASERIRPPGWWPPPLTSLLLACTCSCPPKSIASRAAIWNKYWIATLSASPLLSNAPYIAAQMKDLADKLESAEGGLSHFGRAGGATGVGGSSYLMGGERAKKDESPLKKIVRDASKISREHLQAAMTQAMKHVLFNSAAAEGARPTVRAPWRLTEDADMGSGAPGRAAHTRAHARVCVSEVISPTMFYLHTHSHTTHWALPAVSRAPRPALATI